MTESSARRGSSSTRRGIGGFFAAAVLAAAPGLFSTALAHGRGDGPTIEITSPRAGITTGSSLVPVDVAFTAPDPRRTPPRHAAEAHTIVLTVDGDEVDRFVSSSPLESLTQEFLVDLSERPDGPLVFGARVLGTIEVGSRKRPRTETVVVARSERVRIRLDRDPSNGVIVGPAGGDVTTLDKALTLTIPEGAVRRPRTITVRLADSSTVPPSPDETTVGAVYEMLPHGLQFAVPVTVTHRTPVMSPIENGIAGELTDLRSVTDGTEEDLAGQVLNLDGNSGWQHSSGLLSHFSELKWEKWNTRLEIEGVDDLLVKDQVFTTTARLTDTETSTLGGRVFYVDTGMVNIERVPPGDRFAFGRLTPRVADRLVQATQYKCTREGVAYFLVRPFFEELNKLDEVGAYKHVYCTEPGTEYRAPVHREGPLGFKAEVRVNPSTGKQAVGGSFVVTLHVEVPAGQENGISNRAFVRDLNPGVLSDPRNSGGKAVRRSETAPGSHKVEVDLKNGSAVTDLFYQCVQPGTTHLVITVARTPPGQLVGGEHGDFIVELTCESAPETNTPPAAQSPSPQQTPLPAGTPYSIDLDAFDPDGDTLIWDLLIRPDGMTIDPSTGEIRWTPASDQAGDHPVRVRVSDGHGGEATLDFTLTVASAPPPPPPVVPLTLTAGVGNPLAAPGVDPGFVFQVGNPNTVAATNVSVTVTHGAAGVAFTPTMPPAGWNCAMSPMQMVCDTPVLPGGSTTIFQTPIDTSQVGVPMVNVTASLAAVNPLTTLVTHISATMNAPFLDVRKVHAVNNDHQATFDLVEDLGVVYVIGVTNVGAAAATSFTIRDSLHTALEFLGTTPPGACTSGSGPNDLVCSFWSLAPGASMSFQVLVKPTTTGIFTNQALATDVRPHQGASGLSMQNEAVTTVTASMSQPPVASYTFNCVDRTCTFDASGSSDPDGMINVHSWDLGDGTIGMGRDVEHTYQTAGSYTVTLTVEDNEGLTATATQQIFVTSELSSAMLYMTRSAGPAPLPFLFPVRHDPVAGTMTAPTPMPFGGTQPGPMDGGDTVLAVADQGDNTLTNTSTVHLFVRDGTGNWVLDAIVPLDGNFVRDLAFDPARRFLWVSYTKVVFGGAEEHLVTINVATKTVGAPLNPGAAHTRLAVNPDPTLHYLYSLNPFNEELTVWSYDASGSLTPAGVLFVPMPNDLTVKGQTVYVGTNEGTQFVGRLTGGIPSAAASHFVNLGNTGLFGQAVYRNTSTGNACVYTVSGGGELRIFLVNEAQPMIQSMATVLPGAGETFWVPAMSLSDPFVYVMGDGPMPAPPPPLPPPPPIPMPFVAAYLIDPATCGVVIRRGTAFVPAPPGPPIDVLASPH